MTTRRFFIAKMTQFAGSISALLVISQSALAEGLKLIDMTKKKRTDPDNLACVNIATPIGYVEDLSLALKAKTTTKKDYTAPNKKVFKPSDQTCDTCALYNMSNKTPALATCVLIPKCLVHAKGSCNSWSPKANA